MSVIGVGRRVAGPALAAVALAWIASLFVPALRLVFLARGIGLVVGAFMVVAWLVVLVTILVPFGRCWSAERLCRTGWFSVLLHPIYVNGIALLFPGLALLSGAWPGVILGPLVGWLAMRRHAPLEEQALEVHFGDEWRAHVARVRRRRPRFVAAVVAGLGATAVGWLVLWGQVLLPWSDGWGATGREQAMVLPGDEIVAAPIITSTRAITVARPPAEVWPWLVQMGQGRGGWYSYDFLENISQLDIHSAGRILPQHQHLEPGDVLSMAPGEFGPPVVRVEPERAIVSGGEPAPGLAMSWGFYTLPTEDGGTRVVSRWRFAFPDEMAGARLAWQYVFAPLAFLMEQKMLRGIRDRAEGRDVPWW